VGAIYKNSNVPGAIHGSGVEFYAVATKFITQLPRPVLLSGGALGTKAQVDGVLGFQDEFRVVFFGNVDLVATDWLALGVEVKQGPDYGAYQDAFYYNVHAGWFVTKNTTLAIAFAHPGKKDGDAVGFGKGLVVGLQQTF